MDFINIGIILRDLDITSSLPTTSVKFPIPISTYKLGLSLSTKIFNFNQFMNTLGLDVFVLNPEVLPCNCDGSSHADKCHKHIVTGDLRIIKNNFIRKLFIKGPKFIKSKPINSDKPKSIILTIV